MGQNLKIQKVYISGKCYTTEIVFGDDKLLLETFAQLSQCFGTFT